MKKDLGQIKFTETDDGYKINVVGKDLKELFSCCCSQMKDSQQQENSDCCSSGNEKE